MYPGPDADGAILTCGVIERPATWKDDRPKKKEKSSPIFTWLWTEPPETCENGTPFFQTKN